MWSGWENSKANPSSNKRAPFRGGVLGGASGTQRRLRFVMLADSVPLPSLFSLGRKQMPAQRYPLIGRGLQTQFKRDGPLIIAFLIPATFAYFRALSRPYPKRRAGRDWREIVGPPAGCCVHCVQSRRAAVHSLRGHARRGRQATASPVLTSPVPGCSASARLGAASSPVATLTWNKSKRA